MAIFVPWTIGSCLGYVVAGAVDTNQLGLDIAFPGGDGRTLVGHGLGPARRCRGLGAVAVAVPVGLVAGASVGLVAGATIGPCFGLAVPPSPNEESSAPETPEPSAEAGLP